jgi:hypothetical protein
MILAPKTDREKDTDSVLYFTEKSDSEEMQQAMCDFVNSIK